MNDYLKKRTDALEDRVGLKIASRLSAGASDLPYDISERLRAARAQAVAQRKIAKTQTAAGVVSAGGSAALIHGFDEGLSLWTRIGAFLPLITLVVGLLTINAIQNDNRAQEVAEVDEALLTDELPPAAFADPGFVQYLKALKEEGPPAQ